uniref:Uncharacterized protein n=1 Tax=Oryza glumipatula TaxID=40148 RepID=A0A0D9ZFU2_9ORYZ
MDAFTRHSPPGIGLCPGWQPGVVLPVSKNTLEITDLGLEADAAVGVHGADLAQILAVAAESADVGRVQTPKKVSCVLLKLKNPLFLL